MTKRPMRAPALLGAVAAGALALGAAAPVLASETTFPENGGFDGTSAPWTSTASSSGNLLGLSLLAKTSNSYLPATGAPPGAVEAKFSVLLNVANLLALGQSTWTSAPFGYSGAKPRRVSFSYARKADIGPLLQLGGTANATAILVDLTTGARYELSNTDIVTPSGAFATVAGAVPDDAIVSGHTYQIELRSTFTALAAVLANSSLQYDNVVLTVKAPTK